MNFFVLEDSEFRIGRSLIANYLVGNTYRLTIKNQEFVADLVERGKAQYGTVTPEGAQIALRASGRISVK